MSHTNITIPVSVGYRDLATNPHAPEFYFIGSAGLSGPPDPNGAVNLWKFREYFLSWPLDDWKAFIAKTRSYGPLRIGRKGFERWQKLLREALIRPAHEWRTQMPDALHLLRAKPRIVFDWDREPPEAIILAHNILEAMIATVQIDKLRSAEFRVCARHDCKNPPFRVEARQKKFCSMECAHLVAVRKSRAEAAKKKATSKARSKRRG